MDEELQGILNNEELDTSARVEAIKSAIGKKFVPTSKYTEQTNELAKVKETFETFKASKMTDSEKQEEALRMEKEKSELNSKKLSELYIENAFTKSGFSDDEYKSLIPSLIQADPEATKLLAENLCNVMKKQKETATQKFQETLVKNQKKPESGSNPLSADDTNDLASLYEKAVKENNHIEQARLMRLMHEAKNKR